MPLRRSLLVGLVLPLAACSSQAGSDWSSVYSMVTQYVNGAPPISLNQAAAVPYASIGVRIGDGPQAMLVLATTDGDNLMWVAGHSVAISTRGGRVVRTSGLDHDLTALALENAQRVDESGGRWAAGAATTWIADYADENRYSVQISCRRGPMVESPVTLLGKTIPTARVDEACEAPSLGWTFVNSFWVDTKSGFVWRSVQYIRPDLDPLEIDVLRPPA